MAKKKELISTVYRILFMSVVQGDEVNTGVIQKGWGIITF